MVPVHQEIQLWLTNSKDYGYGLSLLKIVSPSNPLISTLEKGPTTINQRYLVNLLNKHLQKHGEKQESPQNVRIRTNEKSDNRAKRKNVKLPAPQIHKKNNRVIINSNRDRDRSNSRLGIEITQVTDLRKSKYKLRGHLHGRLHAAKTVKERYQLATDIMALQNEIDALNADLERLNNGEFPKHIALKLMTAEDYKNYRNIQSYLARYRTQIANAKTLESKKRAQSHLKRYEEMLNQLLHPHG